MAWKKDKVKIKRMSNSNAHSIYKTVKTKSLDFMFIFRYPKLID